MEQSHQPLQSQERKYSIAIQIISSIYALFYFAFFIFSFIPSPEGSPIADHPYSPWDLEMITVKLLFVLFMTAYYYSWKSRLISGLIYLSWCIAVFYQNVYIARLLHVAGDGIMFIPPVFIIACILIISGIRRNRKERI